MNEGRVNHGGLLGVVQQVIEIAEMSVTATHSIASTVLVQHEHLTWTKPALDTHAPSAASAVVISISVRQFVMPIFTYDLRCNNFRPIQMSKKFCFIAIKNLKSTTVPCLITSVWHEADPGFLAVIPQVTLVINPVVGCRYFPLGPWLLSQPKRSPLGLGRYCYIDCHYLLLRLLMYKNFHSVDVKIVSFVSSLRQSM